MTRQKEVYSFLEQQRKREKQLLSNVLKCFENHKQNTLKDLEVLKHNLTLKGGIKKDDYRRIRRKFIYSKI